MTMFAFFVFGAFILAPALESITWQLFLYAILSLTIVRMVPVALSLIDTEIPEERQVEHIPGDKLRGRLRQLKWRRSGGVGGAGRFLTGARVRVALVRPQRNGTFRHRGDRQ